MDNTVFELTMTGEEIEEEKLLSIMQEGMVKRLKPMTGTLWKILDSSTMRKDKSRNKYIHNPKKVRDTGTIVGKKWFDLNTQTIFFVICQLAFC